MPGRPERLEAIRAIEEARGSTVVIYVTSTREGLEAQMAMDVVPVMFEHLKSLPEDPERRIDLLIHSNGGQGIAPWRLMTLLREFCDHLAVLVPHRAFSAATLAALGADEIVMGPMGMLGPTDPTITTPFNPPDPQNESQRLGISVEDVLSYISLVKDDVGITHEDELVQAFRVLAEAVHPLALGNVKRSNSQGRLMGDKLLRTRSAAMTEHEIGEVVNLLSSKLYFHGHPINRQEARDDLGLHVAEDSDELDTLMWEAYALYRDEMRLDEPFNQFVAAYRARGGDFDLPNPPQVVAPGQVLPSVPNVWRDILGPETVAMVESMARTDRAEVSFSSVIYREWNGPLQGNLSVLERGWRQEGGDDDYSEASSGSEGDVP